MVFGMFGILHLVPHSPEELEVPLIPVVNDVSLRLRTSVRPGL